MWAKDDKNWAMNKDNKTAWKGGKIVDKKSKANMTMESDNTTKTAYPDGEFVEFDDCVKYNNNTDAENGGCSQGAVDGVVKTKKSKESVISKDALYYEVSKKTGRPIEEVKRLIETSISPQGKLVDFNPELDASEDKIRDYDLSNNGGESVITAKYYSGKVDKVIPSDEYVENVHRRLGPDGKTPQSLGKWFNYLKNIE
jgi:hypothetical protein